jgi:hypothetical protein
MKPTQFDHPSFFPHQLAEGQIAHEVLGRMVTAAGTFESLG